MTYIKHIQALIDNAKARKLTIDKFKGQTFIHTTKGILQLKENWPHIFLLTSEDRELIGSTSADYMIIKSTDWNRSYKFRVRL